MRLYRFWARSEARWADGWECATAAYAGSDASLAEAQQRADERLAQRLQWFREGKPSRSNPFDDYDLARPIREAVLWREDSPDGQPSVALTRSNNGYLVLNTTRLMIVDVDDLPRPAGQRMKSAMRGLWARLKGEMPDPLPMPDPVAVALQPFLAVHPGWGLRVYKTFAGYRYLVTHAPLDARQPEHLKQLLALHADPVYVRLCLHQGCYRARLTPKAHRIGWFKPAQTFPFTTDNQVKAQREWEQSYGQIAQRYSTVALVGQYGVNILHPELRPLVELHDQHALNSGLPLA